MSRMSRRERLIRTAERMGLSFPLSITDNDLAALIGRQPATERQLRMLADFVHSQPGNRELPPGLTFGRARELVWQLRGLLNRAAVEQLRLAAGVVLRWQRRYYYVMSVGSEADGYVVLLQAVGLWRAPGSPRAEYAADTSRPQRIDPVKLRYGGAYVVDLTQWQLPSSDGPIIEFDGELPF